MFEVSADVGAKNGARAKKKTTPKKRQRARQTMKKTRKSASHLEPPVVPKSTQAAVTTPALAVTAASTTVAPAHHPSAPVRAKHLRTIALAGVSVVVVAALMFPRASSAPRPDDDGAGSELERQEQLADRDGSNPQPVALEAAPIAAPSGEYVVVTPRAVTAPSKKTLVPKSEKTRIAESTKPRVVAPVAEIPFKEDAATKLPGSQMVAPPAPPSVSTSTGGISPVTITGCLEISVNQDEFRLTDTEGVNAPKSRSWRTGFLKKRSASVALVEPPDRLALQTHVGRRVAATGLLTSHDLKVSALRVVGPRCN
jgi:hypothetical protein